jgi:hypothetical protein
MFYNRVSCKQILTDVKQITRAEKAALRSREQQSRKSKSKDSDLFSVQRAKKQRLATLIDYCQKSSKSE